MNLECPYCEKELEDPADCYEPNTTYEHYCPHCEKNFIFTLEYYPSYTPDQAQCLNGGEHSWKETTRYPREYLKNERRCEYCRETKTI